VSCTGNTAACDGDLTNGCECALPSIPVVSMGTGSSPTVDHVFALPDAGVVAVGSFSSSVTFGALTRNGSLPGSLETFVVKLASDGAPQALTRIGASGSPAVLPAGLMLLPNGHLLVVVEPQQGASALSAGHLCIGGTNAGQVCASHAQCSGGTCGASIDLPSVGRSFILVELDETLAPVSNGGGGPRPRRLLARTASSGDVDVKSVVLHQDGSFVLVGDVQGAYGFGDACIGGGTPGATCVENADCSPGTCGVAGNLKTPFLAAFTAAGALDWLRVFGDTSIAEDEGLLAAAALPDNGVVATGFY
jgi:hypothetical protein